MVQDSDLLMTGSCCLGSGKAATDIESSLSPILNATLICRWIKLLREVPLQGAVCYQQNQSCSHHYAK